REDRWRGVRGAAGPVGGDGEGVPRGSDQLQPRGTEGLGDRTTACRRAPEGHEAQRPGLRESPDRPGSVGAVRGAGGRGRHRGQDRRGQPLVSRETCRAARPGAPELMAKKVPPEQRDSVLRMLAQGQDRDTIAAAVGVTPGQVSAVAAHVKMGTYTLPEPDAPRALDKDAQEAQINPILLGT